MKSKAELIVLNHTKFGENSIVLHTLSAEYGRHGFLVNLYDEWQKGETYVAERVLSYLK